MLHNPELNETPLKHFIIYSSPTMTFLHFLWFGICRFINNGSWGPVTLTEKNSHRSRPLYFSSSNPLFKGQQYLCSTYSLSIISNLEMTRIQEDVHRFYANTTPFYLRDLSILVSTGVVNQSSVNIKDDCKN